MGNGNYVYIINGSLTGYSSNYGNHMVAFLKWFGSDKNIKISSIGDQSFLILPKELEEYRATGLIDRLGIELQKVSSEDYQRILESSQITQAVPNKQRLEDYLIELKELNPNANIKLKLDDGIETIECIVPFEQLKYPVGMSQIGIDKKGHVGIVNNPIVDYKLSYNLNNSTYEIQEYANGLCKKSLLDKEKIEEETSNLENNNNEQVQNDSQIIDEQGRYIYTIPSKDYERVITFFETAKYTGILNPNDKIEMQKLFSETGEEYCVVISSISLEKIKNASKDLENLKRENLENYEQKISKVSFDEKVATPDLNEFFIELKKNNPTANISITCDENDNWYCSGVRIESLVPLKDLKMPKLSNSNKIAIDKNGQIGKLCNYVENTNISQGQFALGEIQRYYDRAVQVKSHNNVLVNGTEKYVYTVDLNNFKQAMQILTFGAMDCDLEHGIEVQRLVKPDGENYVVITSSIQLEQIIDKEDLKIFRTENPDNYTRNISDVSFNNQAYINDLIEYRTLLQNNNPTAEVDITCANDNGEYSIGNLVESSIPIKDLKLPDSNPNIPPIGVDKDGHIGYLNSYIEVLKLGKDGRWAAPMIQKYYDQTVKIIDNDLNYEEESYSGKSR